MAARSLLLGMSLFLLSLRSRDNNKSLGYVYLVVPEQCELIQRTALNSRHLPMLFAPRGQDVIYKLIDGQSCLSVDKWFGS